MIRNAAVMKDVNGRIISSSGKTFFGIELKWICQKKTRKNDQVASFG